MRHIRRFMVAVMMAAMLAAGATSLEAKGKGSGDGQAALCAYLWQVITYPGVNPYIQQAALDLFNKLGCQPPQ